MIKKINGYNVKECYEIDENGTVYNTEKNKIIKPCLDKHGYYQIKLLTKDGKRKSLLVHRLVALTYCSPPPGPVYSGKYSNGYTVDHIDGNKTNNHYSNLRWVSFLNNTNLAKELGYNSPEKKYEDISEKLVIAVISDIENLYNTKEIMERNNVSKNLVLRIAQGKRWKHLTKDKNLKMPYSHKPRNSILTLYYILLNYSELTAKQVVSLLKDKYCIFDIEESYIFGLKRHKNKDKYIEYIKNNNFEPSTTIPSGSTL